MVKQHGRRDWRGTEAERLAAALLPWLDAWLESDGLSDIWVWDSDYWRYFHRGVGCQASRSSDHTVANNTPTEMEFDVQEWDTHGGFTPTDTQLFGMIPGYYLCTASVSWYDDGAGTGFRRLHVRKNGTDYLASAQTPGVNGVSVDLNVSAVTYLNGTTDYVEFVLHQTSGGNLDTYSAGLNNYQGTIVLLGHVYG